MSTSSPAQPLFIKKGNRGFLLFRKIWWVLFLLLVLIIGVLWWGRTSETSVFRYVLGGQSSVKTVDGRVNILLLGIAGGTHDGPNLTDTMIVASYDTQTKKVSLISIPRDLWLTPNMAKVNALYQIGLNKGNGLGYARKGIEGVLGIEIPYAIRMDFSGFIKAVDLVGGLDINVVHSFDDYSYPIEGHENDTCEYKESLVDVDEGKAKQLGVTTGKLKALLDPSGNIATIAAEPEKDIVYSDAGVLTFFHCRFEHLSFKAGPAHFDGETALKFVRSRHGNNGEGSDFARSRRQQLVLQAFKDKVLSMETLLDPGKIVGLVQTFGSSIETNIPQADYLEFVSLVKKVKEVNPTIISSEGKNPLLINPPVEVYGVWALIPPNNDFSMIRSYISDVLHETDTATKSAQPKNQQL